jgi:Spy/CpxP family protein refolding chaperone
MIDAKLALLALTTSGVGIFGLGAWKVHAQGGFLGHRHPVMIHKFIDFAVNEKLDEIVATEAQKQKVREVKERLMKDGRALHESRTDLREKVLALLAQDNPDPAQLKALICERTAALRPRSGVETVRGAGGRAWRRRGPRRSSTRGRATLSRARSSRRDRPWRKTPLWVCRR